MDDTTCGLCGGTKDVYKRWAGSTFPVCQTCRLELVRWYAQQPCPARYHYSQKDIIAQELRRRHEEGTNHG